MPELITLNNIDSDAVDLFTALATDNATLNGTTTLGAATETVSLPTFEVLSEVEYLVVAGGGGGGLAYGGGGGAGGYRTSTSSTLLTGSPYTVTVGAGGPGTSINPTVKIGSNGSPSVFSEITSSGGGGGASADATPTSGGSGGGGAGLPASYGGNPTGANGNTPSTVPSQGNKGGNGAGSTDNLRGGGGGGGAGAVGGNGSVGAGGTGGNGAISSITGTPITLAGGGGGGVFGTSGAVYAGGAGGGGASASGSGTSAIAGASNTGGGGGGGSQNSSTVATYPGAAGGSGVVILKYPDTYDLTIDAGLTSTTDSSTVAGYKITTFTAGTGNIHIASAVLFDISQSSIFVHDTATANFTANFTNVPTTNDRTISAALIIPQGATGYLPTAVEIDGESQVILWQESVTPEPSINATDVVRFTLLRSGGTWSVLGAVNKFGSV
jgi:hypothetical protein